ncbi:hypothetical protein ABFS82_12G037400 [Erythranthe guttata]|uniref:F-box domain-containing protein n=1 Tax=Erythranthe guttata TaxID=4155 RepID=A0A022QS70_ERYGU|nr:PREDICTED: F-box protein At5g39450-like [Erythranthe guttata]EYU31562.1 hypothetical protein MIMGU_mgv1a006433mg [Erythranthe guttata]|eukprot:XP_012844451.1 PREDICTED: F-box protein At5g39450-like [Erythranthe guttata]
MSRNLYEPRSLLSLPDDIFSVITNFLSPKDVCRLGLGCPLLNSVLSSDKVWIVQCNKLGLIPFTALVEWRNGVCSYKSLCKFLVNIRPLIGIWVHQNPELGNVVYVMPGFLSVVGCRIIPQVADGPILWTPVFEILCDHVGSTSFFLHGRERGDDCIYPGLLKSVERKCNVLSLEASCEMTEMPFSRLESDDRARLLDVVTREIGNILPEASNVVFFPRSSSDFEVLHERRLSLLRMYDKRGGLSLRGVNMELDRYLAWPRMDKSQSSLYKLTIEKSTREYGGLWGGTFGWPPSAEKPGGALFLILISYEESKQLMIGTKILEGNSYVCYPNGSAMFIVNADQSSEGIFPFHEGSDPIEVKESFSGEGIANGYGMRLPNWESGSLFVLENGLLVFLWEESREVLTLKRLDLGELLTRGERVNSLSPVSNFAYLTKTYTNVYSGF